MKPSQPVNNQHRRKVLKQACALAAIPVVGIVGCGGGSSNSLPAEESTPSNNDPVSNPAPDPVENTNTWASGGTSAMTANFPDDSLFTTTAACALALTGSQTQGPCYFSADTLDDISEGETGLPMQLCLRLIDSQCNPLSSYEVEVWHCDTGGFYSGNTQGSADSSTFRSSFCTEDNANALQKKWFRGTLITDSNGRVNFKSCFPGWYSGRVIHVHFRIRNNNANELISQFAFTDAFCNEVCTTHPDYIARGLQDTPITTDNVFNNNFQDYIFDTKQNDDGSLLAWKTIQII